MSFYELDRPGTQPESARARLKTAFSTLGKRAGSVFDSFAYARMMSVMHRMDDADLARIGITRADIPAHVDRCMNRTR